jgi:hypothetical protein
VFVLAAALIVAGVALFVAAPLGNGLIGARKKNAGELEATRYLHERALAVQGLRELEFDREMGKLSDADYTSMRAALEGRALTAMTALEKIDAAARKPHLAPAPKRPPQVAPAAPPHPAAPSAPARTAERGPQFTVRSDSIPPTASRKYRFCPQCGMRTAPEANFCAECGLAFRPAARATTWTE